MTPIGLPTPRTAVWLAVLVLGVTQIIGYGTLYYAYAILVPHIAEGFGVGEPVLFGIFSIGLLASGLAAPRLGAMMDSHGPALVMSIGSLAAATILALLAVAPSVQVFAVLLIALGVVSVAVLYDAAFAALAALAGGDARRMITNLTLIAGLASTIWWPATAWLADAFGWRIAFLAFALLHLLVALPLHVWLLRHTRHARSVLRGGEEAGPVCKPLEPRDSRLAFAAVAMSFAMSAVVIAALGVHLVPVLLAMNLGAGAYAVSMLMGPSQVLIRLVNAFLWRNLHPLQVAIISAVSLPAAVAMLFLPLPPLAGGALFAVLFGVGQGLSSIVRGTLPLALFGSAGFGSLLGRLASIRMVLSAAAPVLFALSSGYLGAQATLALALGLGAAAAVPLLLLRLHLSSREATAMQDG